MINVYNKRVLFKKGNQKKFLDYSKKHIKVSWLELAIRLKLNYSTLKSYRNEFCTIPLVLLIKICNLTKFSERAVLIKYKAKIIDFKKVIGRKCLGESRTRLSKVSVNNKTEKFNLDTSKVAYSLKDKQKRIILPKELTPKLAEEMGMHYGDGFLSSKKYEYRLKGNKDEKEYYDRYISKLYKELFNLDIKIKEFETTYGFELYSKAVWQFKNKVLGISSGKKDDIDFPNMISVNGKEILISFIRGIFDTDGSVSFQNKYGLGNYYPIISLALKPEKLINGVYKALEHLGLKPKLYFNTKTYWSIRLCGYEKLIKYSQLIGWNNPKHLNKVKEWKIKYPNLGMAVLV